VRCLLSLLCFCCFAIAAETPVASEKINEATIQKLVKDLDDDDFETRITAQTKLIAIGSPAKAALEAATQKSNSADFKERATII
jgi:hypothetical protein